MVGHQAIEPDRNLMPAALLGRQVERVDNRHPEKRAASAGFPAASHVAGDSAPPPAQGAPWLYCMTELAIIQ